LDGYKAVIDRRSRSGLAHLHRHGGTPDHPCRGDIKMPDSNPLKRLLTALSYRVGATLAAGAVAIPLEPIPGIDALYDIGAPIALIWYWFTFFRDARRMKSAPHLRPSRQQIARDDR
jgi:hypothetical protein